MNLLVVSILSIGFLAANYVPHQTMEVNDNPRFEVTASRSTEEPPSISISFPNGVEDNLVLSHFKLLKQSKGGCNFLGHLEKTPSSSAAVTGCLDKPGDKMEITLISNHNIDKMFSVDYFGTTYTIKTPFENGKVSRVIKTNRDDNAYDGESKREGDEIIDEKEEEAAESTEVVSIPSKLRAVIKFGYEEGIKGQLKKDKKPIFEDWIDEVMAHTQAHFRDPSLGTIIEFQVQGPPLF